MKSLVSISMSYQKNLRRKYYIIEQLFSIVSINGPFFSTWYYDMRAEVKYSVYELKDIQRLSVRKERGHEKDLNFSTKGSRHTSFWEKNLCIQTFAIIMLILTADLRHTSNIPKINQHHSFFTELRPSIEEYQWKLHVERSTRVIVISIYILYIWLTILRYESFYD